MKVIFYADGSCRGNPGNAGYGLYGYSYVETDKPNPTKHPIPAKMYYTTEGFKPEFNKSTDTNIEVINIYECIVSLAGHNSSNNEAELTAIIKGIEIAEQIDTLETLVFYTDSAYVVNSFMTHMDKWKLNNWRKSDGNQVLNLAKWQQLDVYKERFKERGVEVKLIWIEGHSDHYGNIVADAYSRIGSNSARFFNNKNDTVVFNKVLPFKDYKKLYNNKDFVLRFKEVSFTSQDKDDSTICLVNSSIDPEVKGRRNMDTSYLLTIEEDPSSVINKLKSFYRSLRRDYITPCTIDLNCLKDKRMLRLLDELAPMYILEPVLRTANYFTLPGDKDFLLHEDRMTHPFNILCYKVYEKLMDIANLESYQDGIYLEDITDDIYDVVTHKLKLTNKDKILDFTDKVTKYVPLKQQIQLSIGLDTPSYLSLKAVEKDIKTISLIIETSPESNYCTIYMKVRTATKTIFSTNCIGKFLLNKKSNVLTAKK